MESQLYVFVLVLHVIAAVAGVGPTFAAPLLMPLARTRAQFEWLLPALKIIQKFPRVGGPALLVTGLLLMPLGNRDWAAWVIVSLLLFAVILANMVVVQPKLMRSAVAALRSWPAGQPDEIPESFRQALGRLGLAVRVNLVLATIILILMTWQPH